MSAFEHIPAELRALKQWACSDADKLPRQPNGKMASISNPETWSSFEECLAVSGKRNGWGVAFAFTENDPYAVIDLDHVRDAETGITESWALLIIDERVSYTERSRSQTGWHIIVRGKLTKPGNKAGRVEMYDHAKFMTLTGDTVPFVGGEEIVEHDLCNLQDRMLNRKLGDPKAAPANPAAKSSGDASTDDFALACKLARQFNGDAANVKEAFLKQAVQRDKLKRPDYVDRTVTKACAENKPVPPSPEASWPEPMTEAAFHGVAGDFVRLIEPETEADRVALLGNFLIAAGVLFGRKAWTIADGRRHYPIEYLLMAGSTGTGRKGTATARVTPVFEDVDSKFRDRILSGLSSGEGLIKGISPKDDDNADETRRFLILLPEFASLLGVMKREGNTMSAIMREAWDGGRLRVLTRKEPLDVDNVNLSLVAHITPGELLSGLTETEKVNGFANRFLITCVRRSKLLPEGGATPSTNEIVARLHRAIEAAQDRGLMQRDDEARALWNAEYQNLTAERSGMKGALCSRADAHVLRLSLLYALLDGAAAIGVEHLQAALAFWSYCERCVSYLFGGITGDPTADKILGALASDSKTLTELHRVFGNNQTSEWLLAKLADMTRAGLIKATTKQGDRKGAVPAWEKVDGS